MQLSVDVFVFSKMSRPALEPTHAPVQWSPGFFRRGKAAGVSGQPPISI
jgi:hypothetical protein